MLDDLRTINWSAYQVEQLPNWIIGLTSDDAKQSLKAFHKLSAYFCIHSIGFNLINEVDALLASDAPVLASPFLLEVLALPDVKDKWRILYLLRSLSEYQTELAQLEPDSGLRAQQIYQMLLSSFDQYPPFLASKETQERVNTIWLMGHFSEKNAEILELFLQHMEKNPYPTRLDEEEKFAIIVTTTRIIQQNADFHERFLKRTIEVLRHMERDHSETISIRSAAAYRLIQLLGREAGRTTIKMLANILKLPDYGDFWYLPSLPELATALLKIDKAITFDTLLDIFDDHTNPYIIHLIAAILLCISVNSDVFKRLVEGGYQCNEIRIATTDDSIPPVIEKVNDPFQIVLVKHLIAKEELWSEDIQSNLFDFLKVPKSKVEFAAYFYGFKLLYH